MKERWNLERPAPESSPATWARSRPGPQRSSLWGDGGGSPRCSPRTRRSRSSLQPAGATTPTAANRKKSSWRPWWREQKTEERKENSHPPLVQVDHCWYTASHCALLSHPEREFNILNSSPSQRSKSSQQSLHAIKILEIKKQKSMRRDTNRRQAWQTAACCRIVFCWGEGGMRLRRCGYVVQVRSPLPHSTLCADHCQMFGAGSDVGMLAGRPSRTIAFKMFDFFQTPLPPSSLFPSLPSLTRRQRRWKGGQGPTDTPTLSRVTLTVKSLHTSVSFYCFLHCRYTLKKS